jgi:hypothetical protein
MSENKDYLNFLCQEVSKLLNSILVEETGLFFKKQSQVQFSKPFEGSSDLHLCLKEKILNESNPGTFTVENEDHFTVYRNPARIKISFELKGDSIPVNLALKASDKLTNYFFDHRTLEPFLPETYKEEPVLYKKLSAQKAEIQMTNHSFENCYFAFDYSALYHSGHPLKDEQRTKTRIIDLNKNTLERSQYESV